jgi:hypothetical protein
MTWRFQISNLRRSAWLLAWLHSVFTFAAFAHPASGIVVDSQGHDYFIYSAHGVMRIDTSREPTNIHPNGGGHWLEFDSLGSFSRVTPKLFERITPDGSVPSLIFASGGAPLVVGQDGDLYYGTNGSQEDSFAPGARTVARLSPAGKQELFAPQLQSKLSELKDGITGLTEGTGGSN